MDQDPTSLKRARSTISLDQTIQEKASEEELQFSKPKRTPSIQSHAISTVSHEPPHHLTRPNISLSQSEKQDLRDPECGYPEEDSNEQIEQRRNVEVKDPYFVEWDDSIEEMENPKNWSKKRKWYLTFLSSLLIFNAYVAHPLSTTKCKLMVYTSTYASSAPAGATSSILGDLHGSEEVTKLVTSLFVSGYIVGRL
jgi:hypothetical protein